MEISKVKTSEVNTIETFTQAERDRKIGSVKGSSRQVPSCFCLFPPETC
jgi:hypothetical protein